MRSVSVLVGELEKASERLSGADGELCSEVAEALMEMEGRYLDAEEEIQSLGDEIAYLETGEVYGQQLYCAIVERRTEDAVAILRKVMPGECFVDHRSYQRLFPERIR
jgi:hypothetical protein